MRNSAFAVTKAVSSSVNNGIISKIRLVSLVKDSESTHASSPPSKYKVAAFLRSKFAPARLRSDRHLLIRDCLLRIKLRIRVKALFSGFCRGVIGAVRKRHLAND